MTTVFPSILPDDDAAFVDDTYTRAELENMDWDDLRAVAAAADTDAVNGKSEREEIEEALTGHERVEVEA